MAKLIALPSPNGTNVERLYVGQHGIVRQPPAYDAKYGLRARKMGRDEDPEENEDEETEGEYQRLDPLSELYAFLKENLTNPEVYSKAEQLVSSACDFMDSSNEDSRPDRSTTRGGANDSNEILRTVHATLAAQAAVSPYVGEVTASSPAGVYRTALRRLGNDDASHIKSAVALKRIFDIAKRHPHQHGPRMASDARSSLTERFGPDVNRLKRSY